HRSQRTADDRPSRRHRIGAPYGSRWLPLGNVVAMAISRVGVVGSGIMGSGIAECASKTGHEVVLRSRSIAAADAMLAGLEKSLAKQVDRGKLTDEERSGALSRVKVTSDLGELADCDLVVESIVED